MSPDLQDLNLEEIALLKQREVEYLFAGILFIQPAWTIRTCGWLDPEGLTSDTIRKYWTLARERITPNMDGEQAQQAGMSVAMEADVLTDVMHWSTLVPFQAEPKDFAVEIDRRRMLAKAGGLAGKLALAIRDQDDNQVMAIARELAGMERSAPMAAPDLRAVATRFADVVTAGKRSIETFIPPVDDATGGMERQTLSIVAARPSMGKTALMLQIALNSADYGYLVDFYSLEMSAISLWSRVACPTVGLEWKDVRSGRITDAQRAALIQASYDLADRYGDRLNIIEGRLTTDALWRSVAENRPDLVIADHLRLFKDRDGSEVKRLGMITQRLKDVAVSFDCAVLLAAQLSRSVEQRQDKRPMLSDLRDSGEIEENADLVLTMYRDDYYNKPEIPDPQGSLTELIVRKFRDGQANVKIEQYFDPTTERFYPAERRNIDAIP